MRLNVRYNDAHRGFIPVPRVRPRVTLYDDLNPEVLPRRFVQGEEELPKVPYRSQIQFGSSLKHAPYDWKNRRPQVMGRFTGVKRWVTPIGFAETWVFQNVNLTISIFNMQDTQRASVLLYWHWLLRFHSREIELLWLEETQELELAPLRSVFGANGIEAGSIEDPDYFASDIIPENASVEAHQGLSHTYEYARAEQWAREVDYQTWHTSPPRYMDVIKNDDGTCTARPRYGSQFTREELIAAIQRSKAGFKPNPEPWSDDNDITAALDEEREQLPYPSGAPCPMSYHVYDGEQVCRHGTSHIYDEFNEIVGSGPCETCNGSGIVPGLLHIDLPTFNDEADLILDPEYELERG